MARKDFTRLGFLVPGAPDGLSAIDCLYTVEVDIRSMHPLDPVEVSHPFIQCPWMHPGCDPWLVEPHFACSVTIFLWNVCWLHSRVDAQK